MWEKNNCTLWQNHGVQIFFTYLNKCRNAEMRKRIKKIKNNIFAISVDVPATPPNPNNPATKATTKKISAQYNIKSSFSKIFILHIDHLFQRKILHILILVSPPPILIESLVPTISHSIVEKPVITNLYRKIRIGMIVITIAPLIFFIKLYKNLLVIPRKDRNI